jgi:hypothetical protein
MNACFQKLGYLVCRPARDISSVFNQLFPSYGNQSLSSRQWCVRRASESSVVSFAPNLNVEIAFLEPLQESPPEEATPAQACDISSLLNRPVPSWNERRVTA